MAYVLKYFAEFKNYREQEYRLEILQRNYDGDEKRIGDLAGCVLEVQGNMGSIIAPIVKTQLRFTVVDASDIADTATMKYGNWQEFFTPDATLYKVALFCKINNLWSKEWTGYITPDSWKESLDYRGEITITARDNIGHLQDFQFEATGAAAPDENGLVMIRTIFQQAMTTIDFPMTLNFDFWDGAADTVITENSDQLGEAYVNAALFEGMNWYDVLEQTLEAIGYVMRFIGGNEWTACCLRNIPRLNKFLTDPATQELEFYGGTLELDPAVKRIEEEQDYQQQSEIALETMEGMTFGATGTYRCKTDGNTLPGGGTVSIPEHDANYNQVTGKGRTGWDIGSGMLNPEGYVPYDFLVRAEGEEGWKQYAMIAANQVLNQGGTSPTATYTFKTRTAAVKVTFRFTPNPLTIVNHGSGSGKMDSDHYALASVKYYVMFSNGNTTRYWNGAEWVSTAALLEKTYDSQNQYETDFVVELGECDDISVGELSIRLGQITYKMWSDGGNGCYARVSDLLVELNATTALSSNKVTTINSDNYNVLLTRRPLFGALSKEMSFVRPDNYIGGLFYYPTYGSYPRVYPYKVKFSDQNNSYLVPLPVLIHEQILCYYYGAARILQGSAAPTNKALFRFNNLNTYKGHTYLLQGGTMDYFSGVIAGATFREFLDYTDLWSGAPPSYDEQTEYNR